MHPLHSWILTLFTDGKILPHRTVLVFLDMFFNVGWKAFFQICLAIFSILEVTPVMHRWLCSVRPG